MRCLQEFDKPKTAIHMPIKNGLLIPEIRDNNGDDFLPKHNSWYGDGSETQSFWHQCKLLQEAGI